MGMASKKRTPGATKPVERRTKVRSRPGRARGNASTYAPEPIDTSEIVVPVHLLPLVERLARNVHETWARQRIAAGWTYGPQRDDAAKRHPDLVPYDDLDEAERHYDRVVATQTIKLILKLGFRIAPSAD
jgi:hypothetical protein